MKRNKTVLKQHSNYTFNISMHDDGCYGCKIFQSNNASLILNIFHFMIMNVNRKRNPCLFTKEISSKINNYFLIIGSFLIKYNIRISLYYLLLLSIFLDLKKLFNFAYNFRKLCRRRSINFIEKLLRKELYVEIY